MRHSIATGLETAFDAVIWCLNVLSWLTRRRYRGLRRVMSKGVFRLLLLVEGPEPARPSQMSTDDLVFAIPEKTQGWVLEGICKDLQRHYPGKSSIRHVNWRLPDARAYFFPHYAIYPRYLEDNPRLWGRKALVWFTHPRRIGMSQERLAGYLNHAFRIVCMSPTFYPVLKEWGVEEGKLASLIGAADDELFRPHRRDGGAVGFCTAYYERKAPDTVLEIVRSLPHRRFLLLGRNWSSYPRFGELLACGNFRYAEAPYSDYPGFYAQMDVFVSVSRLEGGPIPLIEAMMSNCVPVASRTGFAPQIIEDGRNGFLFDVDTPAGTICDLIERAFSLELDVSATVRHLNWKACAAQLAGIVETAQEPCRPAGSG
jgi:glycosyltransferase involved in cell wall biosynthesis